jgi:starch synthase (maltosyl-transferring)
VKWTADGRNRVIVVVNLDPFAPHEAVLHVPPDAAAVAEGESYEVLDLLTGDRYTWAQRNYVRLDPLAGEPAHLFQIQGG